MFERSAVKYDSNNIIILNIIKSHTVIKFYNTKKINNYAPPAIIFLFNIILCSTVRVLDRYTSVFWYESRLVFFFVYLRQLDKSRIKRNTFITYLLNLHKLHHL